MLRKVEISYKTIVFTALFVGFLWFLMTIRDIVVMVLISTVLTATLSPLVNRLQAWKLPRVVAIGLLYVILWLIIGFLIAGLVPTMIEQTSRLISKIPYAISQIEFLSSHQQEITKELLSVLSALPENVFRLTFGLFGNVINVLTTMVITFYFLLERKSLNKYIPDKWQKTVSKIEFSLGSWLRGELLLMTVVGVMTYVGLVLLGVDSALPLAVLAGTLEIIPSFGPMISAVPAVMVALTVNPIIAIGTGALYWGVQLVENNLLVPRVMASALGVSPAIVLLGLMIGFRLNGPVGAILAVPIIVVIRVLLTDIIDKSGGW